MNAVSPWLGLVDRIGEVGPADLPFTARNERLDFLELAMVAVESNVLVSDHRGDRIGQRLAEATKRRFDRIARHCTFEHVQHRPVCGRIDLGRDALAVGSEPMPRWRLASVGQPYW